MELFIIILLILLGLFLIIAEILLLPGTTLAAIGAILSIIAAAIMSYAEYGIGISMMVFFGSILASGLTIWLCMRAKTLNKISLKESIDSASSQNADTFASIGDKGTTLTRLGPMGSVLINGTTLEARSLEGLIEPRKEIEVIGFSDSIVIVKRIKE